MLDTLVNKNKFECSGEQDVSPDVQEMRMYCPTGLPLGGYSAEFRWSILEISIFGKFFFSNRLFMKNE
jgi:hypothetical protein